ncbi:conserved repeat domain-containing protein [Cognatiyoonia koreensis]|uniref:Conserved repeat domain-containing protein n=1 Tax=Cognatiyoonia koreensis TaxID=364200 RepID=A0A1I0MSE1_9RHOB|nr:DUF11 domain-containing protein [Cognatiyoonia koreensis]SEV91177.1 conserved repeat domain-containing protein [Cognatiyoonia koreensis]
MRRRFKRSCGLRSIIAVAVVALFGMLGPAHATPFTTTVPGSGIQLPSEYPEAGGVVIILTGANGNIYYQFSNPDGAFVGFQNRGQPSRFRGNPFTINDPIALDCGFRDCAAYFGGQIARMDVRFSAYDGDTQVGGFDYRRIQLVMNGFNVGSWSDRQTEITNDSGTTSFGTANGFGNNTFNTGWFSSTNPALLNNILTSGRTTTQVRDDTPNDNYWDFRRGNSLGQESLRTIAPGYELEKTRLGASGGDPTQFLSVGEEIDYRYIVRNIGSTNISNVTVDDDKIGPVTCSPTFLRRTEAGTGSAREAECFGTYTVTQEDFDAQELTNVAIATGTSEFGQLGRLEAEVTLSGPGTDPGLTLTKEASPETFSTVGEVITYTLTAFNSGDVTLSNVAITDPMLSGLSCSFATIAPLSSENTDNSESCTGTYRITQDDIDAAAAGTPLVNNAAATARDPDGVVQNATASATVTGPASAPDLTVEKIAQQTSYAAVGDVINYNIVVTNTGNVTWRTPVQIDDDLTTDETCPNVVVAPGGSVTCSASYIVDQPDLDAESVLNTVDVEISVNGVTAEGSADATVDADVQPLLSIEKSLLSGPNPITAADDELVYEYILRNEGNVALANVDLSDDKVSVTCPSTTIPATGQITCTSGTYIVTQDDINAGEVTNVATATSTTAAGSTVDDATDTLVVPVDQSPSLSIDKSASPITPAEFFEGEEITYSYLVTNDGNTTIDGPFEVNDNKFVDPISCPPGPLDPTETLTCTAIYTITDTDQAAGFVTNIASVTAGTVTSPTDSESVPQGGAPAIGLAKIATDSAFVEDPMVSFDALTETLYYRFTITNTGTTVINSTTQPITLNDPLLTSDNCAAQQPENLFVQGVGTPSSYECTGFRTGVTQADIDAGFVTNTATVSFVAGGSPVESPDATATIFADITPAFTLEKIAPTPATYAAVDEEITFTFRVTNDTIQTLAEVVVTDPMIPTLDCTLTNVAQGSPQTCSGTYIVTQDDLDSGSVLNIATALGTSPTGATATATDNATLTLAPGAANPLFTFDKVASTDTFAAVGDEISYSFAFENTGNITLTDLTVNDTQLGYSCLVPSLAPGETDATTCSVTYEITQSDIDAGSFTNSATATATGAPSVTDAETATGPAADPSYTFAKSVSGDFAAVGDVLTYTLSVTNTGNVTLDSIAISDTSPQIAPTTFSCAPADLEPGETETCSFTYNVRQADIDRGEVTNTADITASPPFGGPIPDTATATSDGPDEIIALRVEKTETDGDSAFEDALSTESFSFQIFNDSNVTVRDLVIDDPMIGLSCPVVDLLPGANAIACDGGPNFETAYTIQQADVDAGTILNEVTVTGTTDQGTTVQASDTLSLIGPDQIPALSIVKSTTSPPFSAVGDVLTYSYAVRNEGNITLTSDITVDDDTTPATCPPLPSGGLAPLATLTCTATYAVTQEDLDRGFVTNTATASINQPIVPNDADPDFEDGLAEITTAVPGTATVNATQLPALAIEKRIKPGTPTIYGATSDVITFEFLVTNTGNVTTTDDIVIDDPQIGANFVCESDPVAPGDTISCETTWSPAQGNIDDGSFTNAADASTVFNGGTIATPETATATANAIQTPELTVTKTLDLGSLPIFQTGATADFTYLVQNTGNETIFGPIEVADNLIPVVTCELGDLLPGESLECTGSYTVTVDDVLLGSVTNLAIGSGTTQDGDVIESDPASATIPAAADPAISITKVADLSTFNAVDQTITYTYTVTNTSRGDPVGIPPSPPPALARPIDIIDDKLADPVVCFRTSDDDPDIAPGETITCSETGTYSITQEDLDAVQAGVSTGFVTNNAFGQTDYPGVLSVISAPVMVTVFGESEPALTVEKSITSSITEAEVDDVITYEITVTNDGNVTVSGILVTDPLIDILSCEAGGITDPAILRLAPEEVAVCTGEYIVTQADIDAQELVNTATASGTTPHGTPVSGSDDVAQTLAEDDPSVDVLKEVNVGEPGDSFAAVGEMLTYTVTVTNDGNVTLSATTVTDILFPGEECLIGPLAPGESDDSCQFVYEVTQEDVDRGVIDNEATARSTSAAPGAEIVEDSDAISRGGPDREPSVALLKSALTASFDEDGDQIAYEFTVANTGNITITDVPEIDDDKIDDVTCEALPSGGLPPSGFITCSGTYTVTQDDVDAGFVTNVASVAVENPLDPGDTLTATDSVTTNGVRDGDFTVTKLASDDTDVMEGDVITYTYRVENTGNVRLFNVTLSDAHESSAGTTNLSIIGGAAIGTIAPGETVTRTSTYTVTQADIDAGNDLTNVATVSVDLPTGMTPLPPETAEEAVTVDAPDPSIEAIKTVTPPAVLEPGEDVVFTVTVENTGNVSLDDVRIVDTLTRNDASIVSPAPVAIYDSGDVGVADVLDVGEIWTFLVTHTLTQDDIDAGGLSNSARAFGTDPFDATVTDVSDNGTGTGSSPTQLTIPPMPGINGVKTITSTTTAVDGVVRFEIAITNTGNVTLTDVLVASDTLERADGTSLTLSSGPTFFRSTDGSGAGTLQVDETAIYRASYVLTQDDVDAGGLSNRAVVSGEPPVGSPVRDVTDDGDDGDGNTTNDPTILAIPSDPSLALRKELTAGGPTFDAVGDALTYTFTVTNSGNVTITDPITIDDPLITDAGGIITCDAGPIAPDDSITCEGTYAVTQDDLDAGEVLNTARATDGNVSSPEAEETVPALQLPALETVKEAVSIEVEGDVFTDIASERFVTDAIVTYEFTVTNTGNVTLTDAVTVSDNLIDDVTCPALPAGGLAPDDALVCEGIYTVTTDDVFLTSVTNIASATSGETESPLVSETVPADGEPALETVKELTAVTNPDDSDAPDLTFDEVGDVLTYTFSVTNTGAVAFVADVNLQDTLIDDPILCFESSDDDPDLRAGETVTCEATYEITQNDLDAGEVVNEAFAETIYGADLRPVVSEPVTETTLAAADPSLDISKSVATLPLTAVDQVLTYTLTIANDGNQTLTDVVATDPLLPGLSCDIGDMAPGAVEMCSDTYQVTQDDIDDGFVLNTASVSGVDPRGDAVESETELTVDGPDATPALALNKTATPDPFGPVGSSITYVFEAVNEGNVTLFDVTITDPDADPDYTCVIPRLTPLASDDFCTLTVAITQDDKDRGEITNTAFAAATDPRGTEVDASDEITTPSEPAMPGIEATKTVSSSSIVLGAFVDYTLTVRNTGDVSLTVPPDAITDVMTRRDPEETEISLDDPFSYLAGDTDDDGLLDVTEVWTYTGRRQITQVDIDGGGFDNFVTITATDPFDTPVSDVSDDGNDGDGDSESDPTEFIIVPGPALDVVKTVLTGGSDAGDEVVFAIAVTNSGDVTLRDVVIADTLRRNDGTDLSADVGAAGLVDPATAPATFAPGETWIYNVAYTLTQDDVDAGGLTNSATATANPPTGRPVSDISDNGDDGDGNTTDDDTVLVIAPDPDFEVVKTVDTRDDPDAPLFVGDVVSFTITVSNNGNVTLTDLVLTDTLTNFDGDALTPDSVSLASGDSETEIATGAANVYTVLYTLTQADIDSGGVQNIATADVVTPGGLPLTDVSDNGDDTDGNTTDDPTVLVIDPVSSMEATKEASIPVRLSGNRFEVTFDMTVSNTGNVTQRDLVITDDLAAFVAPATLISTTVPVVDGFAGAGGANAGFNGTTDTNLVTADVELAPETTGTIQITVVYDVADGFPAQANTIAVLSDRIIVPVTANAEVEASAEPDIFATKSVTPDDALIGSTVTYTLTFENLLTTAESNLTIVDDLPAGIVYTPGTALFNGADTPVPTLTGRSLRWSNVTLAPLELVTITLQARVVGELGEITNRAYVLDADGNIVSNIATATITRRPEPVFDCGDVIGKVFDDRNMNGYQDGVQEPDRSLITDQTYDGGKGAAPIVTAPDYEPGLANVRLATVDGTIITTDEYGRFSVPCAALPAAIGSNFTLKLDERSLPTGYRVTTENPRVVRLTAGTVAKLNFGASIANVVDIDLMAAAFQSGTIAPTAGLTAGVDQLVGQLRNVPSVLRLNYYMNGEGRDVARARLDAVEDLIRERWAQEGQYRLLIERTIRQLQ